MERKYEGVIQTIIETDDIAHLSQDACQELQCGDKVVFNNRGLEVIEKTDNKLRLAYADTKSIIELEYTKTLSGWQNTNGNETYLAQKQVCTMSIKFMHENDYNYDEFICQFLSLPQDFFDYVSEVISGAIHETVVLHNSQELTALLTTIGVEYSMQLAMFLVANTMFNKLHAYYSVYGSEDAEPRDCQVLNDGYAGHGFIATSSGNTTLENLATVVLSRAVAIKGYFHIDGNII